ncbi:TARBP1, partial [Symbiodinium sp. CCMP2456]
MTQEVGKSKDGVPQWDGNPVGFQEYYEMCQLWEATTPWHKRYMNGPRLATELQGAAKRLILGKSPEWLAHPAGTQTLLDHLRACLGRPQLSELSDYLQKYFRQSRRRAGESIGDYVTRKCEVYLRAKQAYHRVRPLHQDRRQHPTSSRDYGTPYWNASRRNSWDSEASSQAAAPVSEQDDNTSAEATGEQQDEWTWGRSQDEQLQGWQTGWGWSGYSTSWWGSPSWHFAAKPSASEQIEELLPDYIQGWLLLQDAGLELRNQWSEQDLKRRDHATKNSGYWGELQDDDEDEADASFGYDEEILVAEGMNEEGLWAMQEAAHEEQEALVILQGARRTLREAREKQKFVKCGRTGHRVADCPDPPTGQGKPDEHAPFVCYAEGTDTAEEAMMTTAPTTEDAVLRGMAVVDGGATKTVASVQAVVTH